MLSGWMESAPAREIFVVEPFDEFRNRAEILGPSVVATIEELPEGIAPKLVILAVKPQMILPVLKKCSAVVAGSATFVSVAAGITMSAMATALPPFTPVIRCMPNTPAAIGEGMMALCAGDTVSVEAKKMTEILFATSGAVAWIESEALMDAVTAISGSGPAYVFHFIEALTSAGIALGLPEETASLLARQTVAGSGRYAQKSQISPKDLRIQVTSPGGTTAAALNVFMTENRLSKLVAEATSAARDRGAELGRAS